MSLTLTSRSLKLKGNSAVRLPIYDFLSVTNSDHMSISHRLAVIGTVRMSRVIGTFTMFPHLLSLGQNFSLTHPFPWAIFLKIEPLHPLVRGKAPTKMKLIP